MQGMSCGGQQCATPLDVKVMGLMELTSLKGSLVGLPGQSGLSVEQRKRLTIGVELVANPSIIFMVPFNPSLTQKQL